jgi:copper chaperone NosL
MITASLLLLLLFVLPLWKITLMAPQYPEGLKMYLNINGISDSGTGDIANINIMNHYVGMKRIDQSDFMEFTYMPYIIVALISSGLIIAFTKKRSLIIAWLVIIVLLGIFGLYDFYRWEYEYGHNLDPRAAIKVPGAAYQPPLLGKKQILNFVAGSFPHSGTYIILVSMSMAAYAWAIEKGKKYFNKS